MTVDLARAVAAARPADLLPSRLSVEGSVLPQRLWLVAADRLAPHCWLAVLVDGTDKRWAAPLIDDSDGLRRARPGDGAAEALLRRLTEPAPAAGAGGAAFRWLATGAGSTALGERAMGVDQTHESVVVGETAVVKWAVTADPSPAPRVLSHLFALGFTDVPEPWGFVEHDGRLVAAVDRFLPHAQDGWTWCVDELASEAVGGHPASTRSAALLGDLVGRLHVALSTPSAFIAEPVSAASVDDVTQWHTRAADALNRAVESVDGEEGERLGSVADRARRELSSLLRLHGTPVMPVHGDLHIGQVLRWAGGHALTDFDGNPVLPAPDRSLPEPAARDVAGMLQSLDHVGRVVVRRVEGASSDVVTAWIHDAQRAFLDEYRRVLHDAGRAHLLDPRLLRPFAVEQECREYAYAATHLPRWRYVPDAAMAALMAEE